APTSSSATKPRSALPRRRGRGDGASGAAGGGTTAGAPAIVSSPTGIPSAPRSPRTKGTFGGRAPGRAAGLPPSPAQGGGGGGGGAAVGGHRGRRAALRDARAARAARRRAPEAEVGADEGVGVDRGGRRALGREREPAAHGLGDVHRRRDDRVRIAD